MYVDDDITDETHVLAICFDNVVDSIAEKQGLLLTSKYLRSKKKVEFSFAFFGSSSGATDAYDGALEEIKQLAETWFRPFGTINVDHGRYNPAVVVEIDPRSYISDYTVRTKVPRIVAVMMDQQKRRGF